MNMNDNIEDTSINFFVLSDIIDSSYENFLGKILISNKTFLDLKHIIHNFVPNSDTLEYPCLLNHGKNAKEQLDLCILNYGKNAKEQLDKFKSYPLQDLNVISKLKKNLLDQDSKREESESSAKMEINLMEFKVNYFFLIHLFNL